MIKKGFTLIELIMIIVIIAILAAVVVPKFMELQEEAIYSVSINGDVEYFCHEKGVSLEIYKDSRVLQKEYKEWLHNQLNTF